VVDKAHRPPGSFSKGTVLGDYSIEALLGHGGMGEVFRARDGRLERWVALKILPADYLRDPDRRRRFQREAKSLAALNHPNIVTVFSVEEGRPRSTDAGSSPEQEIGPVCFMTMELVEGETLTRSIPQGGMPLDRFFELAVALADALAAAHAKGIIHRDLKPDNILLDREGRPKILDFGLAKSIAQEVEATEATAAVTASLETRTGTVLGTVGYMSPEQVRGEPVDERSDLFSLGLVLYEMAVGRRAFDGRTSADLMSGILRDSPTPPDQARPSLPHHLSRVIRRCLEKDAERRYQSAKDVRNELADLARELDTRAILEEHALSQGQADPDHPPGSAAHWLRVLGVTTALIIGCVIGYLMVRRAVDGPPGAETPNIQSLAVLPLDNLMNDPEQDYFVEGMHEALITDLAKISALRVISRTSAMLYAGSAKSVPEIAQELGVDALVEGSVLRADNRVRITAQLIDGRSDQHLWAQSYDRELENVLALLSEVAQGIAREIEITLTDEQHQLLTAAPTVDPAAHELFLKGQYYFNSGQFENFPKALDLQLRAVELDPTFARAWGDLAGSYLIHGFFGLAPPEAMIPKALEAARRALKLDAGLGLAHTVIGYIALFFDWDWETARQELELAIKLDPTQTMSYHGYADYLMVMGDCDGSVEQVLRGRSYDPMGGWAHSFVTAHLTVCGRYDEALVEGHRTRTLGIESGASEYFMGWALWLKGEYEAALTQWRERVYGPESDISQAMDRGYAEGGPQGAMLAHAELAASRPAGNDPYSIASLFAAAAQADEAFEWLERAYAARTPQLLHLTFSPLLDPIRDDPRFDDLLRRIGVPE
jgi:serine/threonine protein kinase/TolB-like protein